MKKNKRQRRTLHNYKGSIQEEDTTIINIYAPNIRTPKYIKQLLMDIKVEICSNAILVGDFDMPLTSLT